MVHSGLMRRDLLRGSAEAGLGLAGATRLPRPGIAQETPKKGGTYTFGTGQGFTTLDPHKPGLGGGARGSKPRTHRTQAP